jgi:hypothetical protein
MNNLQKLYGALQVFDFKDLQNFRTFIILVNRLDLKIADIMRYKPCPNCGYGMNLWAVNTEPYNQLGGSAKSMWYCDNCEYDILSDKTFEEESETTIKLMTPSKECGDCGKHKK